MCCAAGHSFDRAVLIKCSRLSRGLWDPRGLLVLWGVRATRGKGPASALAYAPSLSRRSQKQPQVVLDAVNLTRWSFCFRRQTTVSGWAPSHGPSPGELIVGEILQRSLAGLDRSPRHHALGASIRSSQFKRERLYYLTERDSAVARKEQDSRWGSFGRDSDVQAMARKASLLVLSIVLRTLVPGMRFLIGMSKAAGTSNSEQWIIPTGECLPRTTAQNSKLYTRPPTSSEIPSRMNR